MRPRRSAWPAGCGRSRRSRVASSLGADRAGRARGGPARAFARWAAAFVGLNPVLLVLAVGGAHNDTLIVTMLAAALALTRRREPALSRRRGGARRGHGDQGHGRAGAGRSWCSRRQRWRERRRGARAAALSLLVLGAVGADRLRLARAGLSRCDRRAAAARRGAQRAGRDGAAVRPERHAGLVAQRVRRAVSASRSSTRCGAPRAAPTGASPRAGPRSRCCCPRPGCCPGMRSGCCR